MSERNAEPNNDYLTTISAKVPRWVQDEFVRVCRDTGLDESKAYRIALTGIAKIFQAHWRKGPALGPFLEHLEFRPEQYNIFFDPQK